MLYGCRLRMEMGNGKLKMGKSIMGIEILKLKTVNAEVELTVIIQVSDNLNLIHTSMNEPTY